MHFDHIISFRHNFKEEVNITFFDDEICIDRTEKNRALKWYFSIQQSDKIVLKSSKNILIIVLE